MKTAAEMNADREKARPWPRTNYRLLCGAEFRGVEQMQKGDANFDKHGRVKIAVYDSEVYGTDDDLQHPKMPDGKEARCLYFCPANKTKAGRQEKKCFPRKELPGDDKRPLRFTRVVTCCATEFRAAMTEGEG